MIALMVRPSVRGAVWASTLRRRAGRALDHLELSDRELSLVLTDDAEIAELNELYRGKVGPTDVLSFPQTEPDADMHFFSGGPPPLGDIVISIETAQKQVLEGCLPRIGRLLGPERAERWNLREEVTFLMVHGLFHLIGHDHMEPGEAAVMESAEEALFGRILRIPQP